MAGHLLLFGWERMPPSPFAGVFMSRVDPAGTGNNSFEELLAPILGAAYGTALHMTRHKDDAEDLVQEAAVRAFRAFHTFEIGTNFKAWFFRILTNLYLNKYRQKQREPEMLNLDDAPDLYLYSHTVAEGLHSRSTDPATLVLRQMDTEHVAAAIAALPEEFRTVCALYFMEEFAYQEISEILDVPLGTVRSRLHRGRKMLQRELWHIAEAQGITAAAAVGAS
jgi:RNA polymerase sigma-70 factor (ECF subfamily)